MRLLGAHPRSRGDHRSARWESSISWGSSPLARGPRGIGDAGHVAWGLIPARAGTTVTLNSFWGFLRAHPRSRGDHTAAKASGQSYQGSSPLARGPRPPPYQPLVRVGLIPARAGTTRLVPPRKSQEGAHPRSRGDHANAPSASKVSPGSSPLARGPRQENIQNPRDDGLIPARAGTTNLLMPVSPGFWAHPRSRGDHAAQQGANDAPPGSSPLARGPQGAGPRRLR